MKKDSFTQKRLNELEQQLKDFTDEDLLNEAQELELEMAEGHITYEIPDQYFDRILAKGKLVEAERDRNDYDGCHDNEPVPLSSTAAKSSLKKNDIIKKHSWWQFWKYGTKK